MINKVFLIQHLNYTVAPELRQDKIMERTVAMTFTATATASATEMVGWVDGQLGSRVMGNVSSPFVCQYYLKK